MGRWSHWIWSYLRQGGNQLGHYSWSRENFGFKYFLCVKNFTSSTSAITKTLHRQIIRNASFILHVCALPMHTVHSMNKVSSLNDIQVSSHKYFVLTNKRSISLRKKLLHPTYTYYSGSDDIPVGTETWWPGFLMACPKTSNPLMSPGWEAPNFAPV